MVIPTHSLSATNDIDPVSRDPPAHAIADVRYLWSEMDRLKSQVQSLQVSERHAHDEQQRLKDYVASFVTHTQLEAALCTKISQSHAMAGMERIRSEIQQCVDKKADLHVVQTLQSKKLDISVYEASAWDVKKFRTMMEQHIQDLFASFAHQMHERVSSKLSIEDFERIFSSQTTGHENAIEQAAKTINHMKDQLEQLHDYVQTDRERQHQVADIHVSLLDLTRKQNAFRSSMTQLYGKVEMNNERFDSMKSDAIQLHKDFDALLIQSKALQEQITADTKTQQEAIQRLGNQVYSLQTVSNQAVEKLTSLDQFAHETLLAEIDTKVRHIQEKFGQITKDIQSQHQKYKVQTIQQFSKVQTQVNDTGHCQTVLEQRFEKLNALVAAIRNELNCVSGPLLTAAMNLKEENVAILDEIHRSQDESRAIMLDYNDLLVRDKKLNGNSSTNSRPATATLSRPLSSSAASRKGKHQITAMINAMNGTLGNTIIMRPRAQTAGASPTCETSELKECHSIVPRTGPLPSRPPSEESSRPIKPHTGSRSITRPMTAALDNMTQQKNGERPSRLCNNNDVDDVFTFPNSTSQDLFNFT